MAEQNIEMRIKLYPEMWVQGEVVRWFCGLFLVFAERVGSGYTFRLLPPFSEIYKFGYLQSGCGHFVDFPSRVGQERKCLSTTCTLKKRNNF